MRVDPTYGPADRPSSPLEVAAQAIVETVAVLEQLFDAVLRMALDAGAVRTAFVVSDGRGQLVTFREEFAAALEAEEPDQGDGL